MVVSLANMRGAEFMGVGTSAIFTLAGSKQPFAFLCNVL